MPQTPKVQLDPKYLHSQAPWSVTNDLIDRVRQVAAKRGQKASQWVAQHLERAVQREESKK